MLKRGFESRKRSKMVLLNFLTFDLQSLSFFIMIEKRIPSLGIEPGVEFMLRVFDKVVSTGFKDTNGAMAD